MYRISDFFCFFSFGISNGVTARFGFSAGNGGKDSEVSLSFEVTITVSVSLSLASVLPALVMSVSVLPALVLLGGEDSIS